MQSIQFDPKITTDPQIDRRRPASGPTSDPFADQLKRRFDADQRELRLRRREESEPLSGRKPGLVIAHAKTLRGEAKEAEHPDDRCLTDESPCGGDQTDAMENAAAAEESITPTEAPVEHETPPAPADGGTDATTDEPALAVDHQVEATEPEMPIVVAIQPSSMPAAGCETVGMDETAAVPAEPVLDEDGQIVLLAQTDGTADTAESAASESQAESEGTIEQQELAALVENGMTEVVAALSAGQAEAAPTEAAAPASATTAPNTPPGSHANGDRPQLQMPVVPAPPADAAIAAAPRPHPERSSMDIKLRSGTAPQARPSLPEAASGATPSQSAAPHQGQLPQSDAAGGEFGAADDMFEEPFSPDEPGPGWTLHLAQGAASKRADFIAQLRQHLQNLPAHEQVAVHIQRAVREGSGRLSVQLSPAELGRIHVKLEIDEDKRVTAAVTVERPSTLELLQRDIRGLERALHNAGLTMEGGDLSFSLGHGGDREFAQDLSQRAAPATGGSVSGAEAEGDQPAAPPAQVMDTAAGVVNLQV